ncbi:WYL domain-containing protein [Methylobacter tundripaludum]|uniref:WYL domain-containing protein n=1 Tax=Methylobacter tundripaludum TaxID=173365 RepID=UPI0004DF750B|nr:hypothetical protein [Methylobacter tundripaludum]
MSNNLLDVFSKLRNGQAIQARLQWLEDRIFWLGELNRSDLVIRFSVSLQQASSDIKLYQKLAPKNMLYNASKKIYFNSDDFCPLFPKNHNLWLAANNFENKTLRSIQCVPVAPIKRSISDNVLMSVSRSYLHRIPISILYQSMKNDLPTWRTICPHTIVETEIRWHIRAWVANKRTFTDIVPGRILDVKEEANTEWVGSEADTNWNTKVDIILEPSSQLSDSQRAIVERDYQMENGCLIIEMRECLVYYQLSSMYLVDAVRELQGEPGDRNFGVAVKNWQDLLKYVKGTSK